MIIGQGKRDGAGEAIVFEVRIPFLAPVPVLVSPIKEKPTDKYPDFEISIDATRCGALWKKTPRNGGETFLAGDIESPVFPSGKLAVAIFKRQDGTGYDMTWRPEEWRRAGDPEAATGGEF